MTFNAQKEERLKLKQRRLCAPLSIRTKTIPRGVYLEHVLET